MSQPPERTIRKFNPGVFQSDKEVMDQFVVRNRELQIVLEVLRGNIGAPSCQHTLVVAPRGRGKTMLLARVAAELRTDAYLREQLVPVRFMEESLEIFNIGDFWLEALAYLAKECAEREPALSREVVATHKALVREWRDSGIAGRARAAVLDAADQLGRKLVLMVENLQGLCDDVDEDFGWQLRESLQSDPEIMLLATATSRFEGLDDAREPFFELFRELKLGPLGTDECQRLWQVVSGDSRSKREVRALEILTGGSPRLLVIVAEFARHRSLPQLMEELVTLIDDHTEYFRGHLDALAKTERRVYVAVADLWQPSSSREIADRARLSVQKASALLGRLVGRGAVTIEGKGRKRRYAASERLYCIYYKLRSQRDEVAVVRALIRFMASFYGRGELATMFGTMMADMGTGGSFHDAFLRAAREDTEIGEITPGMAGATYRELVKRHGKAAVPESRIRVAGELLDIGSKLGQSGESRLSIEYSDEVVRRFESVGVPEVQVSVAKALTNRGLATQGMGEARAALAAFGEVVTRFGHVGGPEVQQCVGQALLNMGFLHGHLGEVEAAITAYDDAIRRFGDSPLPRLRVCVAMSLRNKGSTLAPDSMDSARATWDILIDRFGDDDLPEIQVQVASALAKKAGSALIGGEGDVTLSTCDEAVHRYGMSDLLEVQREVALALEIKGMAQNQMGRAEDALETYDSLVRRYGDIVDGDGIPIRWRALATKAISLALQGDEPSAVSTFSTLCRELDTDNQTMIHKIVWDTITLIAGGAPPGRCADALADAAERSEVLLPLLAALRKLAGRPMRVPAEVSKVADDVITEIDSRRR